MGAVGIAYNTITDAPVHARDKNNEQDLKDAWESLKRQTEYGKTR